MTVRQHNLATCCIVLGLGLLLVGCNRGLQVAPVAGRVTLDGKPLKFGSVMMQSGSGGQAAIGEIQPDGSFVMSTFRPEDGAIVGQHRIRVTCFSAQDPAVRATAGDTLGKLLIPQKYTVFSASGLTADVPAEGLPELLLELKTERNR